MAYNESQYRTWNRATPNDGLEFQAEFARIYANFVAMVNNGGSAPPLDMLELYNEIQKLSGVLNKTADYTIQTTDYYARYIADTTSNDVDWTLPDLAANYGKTYSFKHVNGTNEMNVVCAGADVISGDSLTTINLPKAGDYIVLFASQQAGAWVILGERISAGLRLDTYAGYGSTDTKIMQFVNSVEDFGNMFSHNHGSYGTAGLEITINKSGLYSFSQSHRGTITIGFSKNSSQLTTSVASVTVTDALIFSSSSATYATANAVTIRLSAGDVIRVHADAGVPSTASWSHFTANYLGG